MIEADAYSFNTGVVLLHYNDKETTLTTKTIIYLISDISRIEATFDMRDKDREKLINWLLDNGYGYVLKDNYYYKKFDEFKSVVYIIGAEARHYWWKRSYARKCDHVGHELFYDYTINYLKNLKKPLK